MSILLTASLFTVVITPLLASGISQPVELLSLNQLEQLHTEMKEELDQLANYSLRSGIGSIGYRSRRYESPGQVEWIRIDFPKKNSIDQIILVPAISRDSKKGFQSDGFPDGFKVYAGVGHDTTERLIASYEPGNRILPRIAPLIISVAGFEAKWIRIETSHLSQRAFNADYVLEFSEIMVFSGKENVALHCSVEASSNIGTLGGAWDKRFLVDGHVPYLMNSFQGSQSLAFISSTGTSPVLQIDLEEEVELNRIHLHTVDSGDTVPQAFGSMLGFPVHLKIEGARHADFSDAITLVDMNHSEEIDIGPIMMWNIPPTVLRYVRLFNPGEIPADSRLGFAEIELFSNGRNIALNKTVHANVAKTNSRRSLTALTDGRNFFGSILPIHVWMNELARRHDLETQLPKIKTEIENRYKTQRQNFHRVSWLATLLAGGVGFTILMSHNLQMRQAVRLKTRFAADIHDELGANLHAIGLLSDIAKESIDSSETLIKTVDKIRALTERSGEAARHCAEMQEAEIFGRLPDDMRRTANRIMTDLEYNIAIEGEEVIEKLSSRTKADLFLFYKESLINISRHSGADQVDIQLKAKPRLIFMNISDDGQGLSGSVPSSLKRRARLLGGQVSSEISKSGGASITLIFRPHKFKFWRTNT
ncbi:MAG: histidine kinase [Pontiella sp.]